MNKMAKKNGAMVNIVSELLSLKAGDKIYIIDETSGNVVTKKRQVWRVTGKPSPNTNTTYGNVIVVPVTYASRPFNITSALRNIENDHNLTVTLERFSQDEELD
jgi:hypothetical protein